MDPLIILGSGLAGYTVGREFRKLNADGPLQIITQDDGHFYSKPMLSNAFKQGKSPAALINTPAAVMAEQLRGEILTQTRVETIDPISHTLTYRRGDRSTTIPYRQLVLALGAAPITSSLTDAGAMAVNDLQDYHQLRQRMTVGQQVALVGAGLIGCEFANDFAQAGFKVTLYDLASWPLATLVPEPVGRFIERRLGALGIEWRWGESPSGLQPESNGYRLSFANAGEARADLVVTAIGLRPRTDLAAAAGLRVERGIVVDRTLQTSAEGIYALGDCAQIAGLVLPYIMPITHAARALAKTLTGQVTPVRYPAMPVVVKTPACPLVVAPPQVGTQGEWQVEKQEEGIKALYYDRQQNLQGFALAGAAASEKQALTRLLPPLLP